MGLIERVMTLVFGSGGNAVKETAEVFRENAEASAERGKDIQLAALAAQSAEFGSGKGRLDRVMDGINRLPRPLMALGCLGLVISAMIDPVWFAARMTGLSLVPEPLWWLLGVIVSFYFGARHQAKGQEFQKSHADTMARLPAVTEGLRTLQDARDQDRNAALEEWKAQSAGRGATM